jgi:pectate lyase
MALLVNGSTVNGAQPFPKTSSSTVFSTSTATVSLNAGGNTIRLQSVSSTATADIDWLEVTGNAPSAGDCNAARITTGSVGETQLLNKQLTGVFPNPAKGKTIISITLGINEQAGIRVYDALGRLVDNLGSIRSVTGGTQQVPFNLNNKKPGVYNVVVTGNKGIKTTYKLFVQ